MRNKNYASVNFDVKLVPQEKINNEFTLCKCYAFGLGKNRNYSHISKENMERCKSTLSYAPVVGHLMEKYDKDGNVIGRYFGGHDYTITADWELKPLTVPYGVVVADSFQYEMVNEYKDNREREYLTCDVILWTGRYPELLEAIYDETTYFNESAELNVEEYRPLEDDSNYVDITDFTFSALCILGKSDDAQYHTEPCFIESKIQPKQFAVQTDEFSNLMDEMKEKISFCFNNQTSNIGIDINSDKGGKNLDKKLEILQKFNKTVEELDFSIDEMTEEELEAKMTELFGVNDPEPITEPESTTDPVVPSSEPVSFSATYNQKRQALRNALDPIVVKDEEGNYVEETYFYVEDFSDEYVYVEKDYWSANDYKCTFGRFAYSFDEATVTATLTSEFEEMVKMWLTLEEKENLEKERLEKEAKFEALEQEFTEYKENYSVTNEEVEELKAYKSNKEAEERKFAEDTLFADYEETIGETEEFKALKSKASEFSLDALKKECLCIVGMYSMTNKPKENKNTNPLKFSFEPKVDDEEPYGGLMKKYLNK